MPTFNIPKQARNKYNYIKGSENNNFITQSQLMMSSGGGGGNGSGLSSSQVQQQINDTLEDRGYVSYTYLKTINGYSLVGEGDIEVTGSGTIDLSYYATKDYVSSYVSTYGGNSIQEVTQAEYDALEQGGNLDPNTIYILSDANPIDLSYYVTKSELDTFSYATKSDLNSYVTKSEFNTDMKQASYVTQQSLSSNGYLNSSNFIYNSSTYTLTINI